MINKNNMIPSTLEMLHPIMMNPDNIAVITTRNGKSLFNTSRPILSSLRSAHKPIISIMLNRLLPITLLTANALFPESDEVILTAASGALVPKATIVRPTISVGIFNIDAILLDPSTKKSDPLINSINPTINKMSCIPIPIKSILFFLLCCCIIFT